MSVVKNQDHVDAIENDRLPCGFDNTLRSAQMLEVFLDRHLLSSSMWRPAREMYGIIIFGLVRRFNFRHAVAVRKLNPFENNRLYGMLCVMITVMLCILIR